MNKILKESLKDLLAIGGFGFSLASFLIYFDPILWLIACLWASASYDRMVSISLLRKVKP